MNSEKYVQNLDLEYLLNPLLQNQINRSEILLTDEFKDEIIFYKKRINQKTKDLCKELSNKEKNVNLNNNISLSYLNLIKQLIYNFKIDDEKDLLQKEYNEQTKDNLFMDNIEKNNECKNKLHNQDYNNYIIKDCSKKKINLDSFVTLKKNNNNRFIPNRRVVDIQDPELRYKGLKKEKSR